MQIDDCIEILTRVKKALNILKMLQTNTQWNKETRERYPVPDINKWYDFIKETIDECVKLIEDKD